MGARGVGVLALGLALGVVGCGGDDDSSASGGAGGASSGGNAGTGATSSGGAAGSGGASAGSGGSGGSGAAGTGGTGSIQHGADLTKADVGPGAIGMTGKTDISPGSVYTDEPSWVTRTIAAGGETIDGFTIPEGVWLVEDCNVKNAFQIYGNEGSGTAFKGIVFRGCRMRVAETVIPTIYVREQANAPVWLLYCELGSPGPSEGSLVPIHNIDEGSQAGTYLYRNFISSAATGIQINAENGHVIENWVEDMLLYEPSLHLNGFTTNGGIQGIEILRNHIVLQATDSAGHSITQTDAVSFFQDFADFKGTAPGGYQVRDNLLGGGGYSLYAGMNSGKPADSVQNMVVTGNRFTTNGTYPTAGFYGPVTATPEWGKLGNVWSNNTWADGPKAGQEL
ncbi:MAG: hypothetical protein R3B13_14825 [Polyangiaceae bacterium]